MQQNTRKQKKNKSLANDSNFELHNRLRNLDQMFQTRCLYIVCNVHNTVFGSKRAPLHHLLLVTV